MAKLSVKKDDYVMIIAGKDKGKTAQIIAINHDNHRALIEGKDLKTVNKKAVKARKATDKGGIIEQPGSIDISNVMPICAACNKPSRVGHTLVDGKSTRVCKACGELLVTKKATAKKATKATKKVADTQEVTPVKATLKKKAKTEAPKTEEVEAVAVAPSKEENNG